MKELADALDLLKLTAMRDDLERALAEAASRNLSVAEILLRLARLEIEERRKRSVQRRFRQSRLQTQWDVESFDFSFSQRVSRSFCRCPCSVPSPRNGPTGWKNKAIHGAPGG